MTAYLINEALQDCEQALGQPEHWAHQCALLSNLFASEGRKKAAYLWQTLAQQGQPSRPSFHVLAAAAYAQLKNWKEALYQNQKALAVDRDLAIAYFNLAQVYENLGQPEKSQDYLYHFIMLRPEQVDAETCEHLGIALLKRGDEARAVQCYLWAIQNDPDLQSVYYRLGQVMATSGKADLAMYCYQQLLQRDPNQGEARHELGKLLLAKGDRDSAISQFRQAIEVKPKLVGSYRLLVRELIALRQWDEVITCCQSVLKVSEDSPWIYRQMAKAAIAKGDQSQTITCYQKLCELEEWPEAKHNDYHFTYDALLYELERWKKCLGPLQAQAGRQGAPVRIIEVGSSQGMRSCWFLDQYLAHMPKVLTCIDRQFSTFFKENINKTKAVGRVQQLQGHSPTLLATLPKNNYDLVVLQDRRQDSEQTYQNLEASWPLLKLGGVIVLRNYQKLHPDGYQKSSKAGAEHFLSKIRNSFTVFHQDQHLWLKKI